MKNILFALFALFVLSAGFVSATACGPAVVTGTVYDQNDDEVANADVTITCNDATELTTTDAYGDYYVEFDSCECDYGSSIYGVAETEDASGSNEGTMCDKEQCYFPIGILDITIPEFGVIAGAFALIAGLGVIAYRRQ